MVAVLRSVVEQAGDKYQILALSTASQCGSLLPVGADGSPIYPIMTWMDSRAGVISNRWQADGTAAQVRQLSGWTPYPGLSLPMLAWLGYAPGSRDAAALTALTVAYCLLPCALKGLAASLLWWRWIRHHEESPK